MTYMLIPIFMFTTIILYIQNRKLLMELSEKDIQVDVLEEEIERLSKENYYEVSKLDLSKLIDTF